MALTWDPESASFVDDEAPAKKPALTPDPLATIGTTPTAIPGVDNGSATQALPGEVEPPNDTNLLAKAFTETGAALMTPVTSPLGFLTGLSNEVNSALSYVASAGGAAPNPVSEWLGEQQIQPKAKEGGGLGVPEFEAAPDYDPTQTRPAHLFPGGIGPETPMVSDIPILRMMPGVKTAEDIQTAEGRDLLKEHPGQVGIDIASLLYPAAKAQAAGVLPSAAGVAGKVTGKAADLLSRTEKGKEFVTKTAESRPGQWWQENMPTSRTPEAVPLAQGVREAEQIATHKLEPMRQAWDAIDDEQRAVVTQALRENTVDAGTGALVFPDNPAMAQAFDAVKEFSEADILEKVSRGVPEGTKKLIGKQAEAVFRKEATRAGVPKQVVDDQIREWSSQVTVDPETGFAKMGATNPHPEFGKSWNRLVSDYNKRVLNHQRSMRVFEITDPNGVPQVYPWEQYRTLKHANAVPEGISRKLEQGRPLETVTADIDRMVAQGTPSRTAPAVDSTAVSKYVDDTYRFGNNHDGWWGYEGKNQRFHGKTEASVRKQAAKEAQQRLEQGDGQGFASLEDAIRDGGPADSPYQVALGELLKERRRVSKLTDELAEAEAVRDAVWVKETPGRFKELVEQQAIAKKDIALRQAYIGGYGKKAAAQATELVDDAMGTWLELEKAGARPVYVPSKSKISAADEAKAPTRATTSIPGSLKPARGVSENGYERDPMVMFDLDQRALALQHVTKRVVADVYDRAGGVPYAEAVAELQARRGLSLEQADRMVRARYSSLDPLGVVGRAKPDTLLIPKDIGHAIDSYLGQMGNAGKTNLLMKAWIVPILWLSPRFHINNIVGGTVMTGLKSGPTALFKYGREARRLVKSGEMDFKVAGGSIMAPGAGEAARFTSKGAQQGSKLGRLWQTLHSPTEIVAASRHMNQFMDSFFRSVTYLDEYNKQIGKGKLHIESREAAWRAASDVLQNWDKFSPFEKNILQQAIPFISWQKTVLRSVADQAIDHPLRTHAMYTLAQDREQADGLPEDWKHKISLTKADEEGWQYFLNAKSFAPLADAGSILTLKGFLGSLTPLVSTPLQAIGYDGFSGGIPATISFWGATKVDHQTGKRVLKPNWRPLSNLVPQLGALAQMAGLLKLPPPKHESPEGMLNWLDRYGSKFGLLPAFSFDSLEEVKGDLRKAMKDQAAADKRAAKKEAEMIQAAEKPKAQLAEVGAGTPTSEPGGGLTWDPATASFK